MFAEQNVGNLKNYTFRHSATPVRRTRRRKSQKMNFQELWDSGSQSNTSEIEKMHFHKFWDSGPQNTTSEISNNALPKVMGPQFAEQRVGNLNKRTSNKWDSASQDKVGNLNKCTSRNSGAPARRTTRRKYQQMHFQKLWDSVSQNNTSEIQNKCTFRISWALARRTKRRTSKL